MPYFVTRAPTPIDESRRPPIIGIVMRPASVGVAPRASCMYWLRKTDAPNIAMPVAIEAMTDSVKVRLRKRLSGMRGSAERSSTTMNSTVARMEPPTMRIVFRLHQSLLFARSAQSPVTVVPAFVTQISSSETATERSTMPT